VPPSGRRGFGVARCLLALHLCCPAALAQKDQPREKPAPAVERKRQEDNPRLREKWFYEERAYPFRQIPAGARLAAIKALDRMLERERRRGPRAPARGAEAAQETMATGTWVSIGPRPINTPLAVAAFLGLPVNAGRIASIAVDPRDSNVVYLGGAQGGIWKTTDGGANWTALTDDQVTLAIGAIALDPSNPDVVYVGTGEQTFSGSAYYGAGLLKSTDAGAHWTHLPGVITNVPGITSFVGPFNVPGNSGVAFFPGGGARIGSLSVHPADGQMLLAGVHLFVSIDSGDSSGIYRSTDGGVTWTNVLRGGTGTEVFFDPTNGNLAYAALGTIFGDPDNGIYRSTDAGVTWTRIAGSGANVIPVGTAAGRIEMAIAPGAPTTLYAGVTDPVLGESVLGLFKTTDGGQNWTRLAAAPDYCRRQCDYDNVMRVHPTDPNIVFAGGAAGASGGPIELLWRTLDGGATWQEVHNSANGERLHVDVHALAFSHPAAPGPLKLYVGNDGGIWSTTEITASPATINWNNLNATLTLAQYYPGHSIHPTDPHIGFGGTQDNGTHRFTGSPAWTIVTGGDGGWTAMDPFMPSTVYTTCQFICIFRSLNSFESSFSIRETGINQDDRVGFIAPLVHDPNNSGRLYFGTFRVYRTVNAADNWASISPDLTDGESTIRTIAVAPSNSDVVYVGTRNARIQRTIDAGAGAAASWSNLTTSDLPDRVVTQIAVDPANPDLAYASFSGFTLGSDTKGHVFMTFNGGASWNDISANLPNTPVNDIVVDPDLPGDLYAATDIGVFQFDADTGTWSTLMSGLPRIAVLSLKLHRPTRTLRAATHGRGMWDFVLTNFNPSYAMSSLSPAGTTAGSPGFTLVVRGAGFTPGSVVRWNGSDRPTHFTDSGQVEAMIPDSDLALGVAARITVFDPGQPAPGSTNALIFTVENLRPTLASLSPDRTAEGGPDFTLTVNGTNFLADGDGNALSVVRWNGSDRPTAFLSSMQLQAAITAADIASTAVVQVTVANPPPGGGTPSFGPASLTFLVASPPPNDDFSNAAVVGGTTFSHSVNTLAATVETTDPTPSCGNGSRANSVWYSFVAPYSGVLTADTRGSGYDTILSVFRGAPGSFTPVACNDDVGGLVVSEVTFTATANTTYFFMVSSFGLNGGATVFNLTMPPSLSVSASPASVTVRSGQSASYTITLTPQGGALSGVFTLLCLNLPLRASCAFNPAAPPAGAAPVATTLTISTSTTASLYPPSVRPPYRTRPPVPWLLALLALALAASLALRRLRRPRLAAGALLALALVVAVILGACGGGGGGGATGGTGGAQTTPPGTYTITVQASSAPNTQSTTLTLVVQ
jgi:photosystem II stability/assembly factor-like uncharacterized protein